MLQLPSVTLIAFSGIGYQTEENLNALKRSCEGVEWGDVKYIQQGNICNVSDWNEAIIKDLYKYVDTSHALLVHSDGHVINPHLWKEEWLHYDYCASPWPLPKDDYSYRTPSGRLIRVGNSVSLRSKKLMELIATRPMEYHYGNNNEDGQICVWERDWLEEQGCKFMPFEEAIYFGKEAPLPENEGVSTFVFHEFE